MTENKMTENKMTEHNFEDKWMNDINLCYDNHKMKK